MKRPSSSCSITTRSLGFIRHAFQIAAGMMIASERPTLYVLEMNMT